ncbi:MAG: hypothetical protein R3D45_10135 [Rhizobiaceae bacterium]
MTELLAPHTIGIALWICGMCTALIATIRTRGRYVVFSINIFDPETWQTQFGVFRDREARPWNFLTLLLCGFGLGLWIGEDVIAGKWWHAAVFFGVLFLLLGPYLYRLLRPKNRV